MESDVNLQIEHNICALLLVLICLVFRACDGSRNQDPISQACSEIWFLLHYKAVPNHASFHHLWGRCFRRKFPSAMFCFLFHSSTTLKIVSRQQRWSILWISGPVTPTLAVTRQVLEASRSPLFSNKTIHQRSCHSATPQKRTLKYFHYLIPNCFGSRCSAKGEKLISIELYQASSRQVQFSSLKQHFWTNRKRDLNKLIAHRLWTKLNIFTATSGGVTL